jgi:hypothetical protein
MSLSQKDENSLLQDIERIGLPLDQISLVDICDAKEGIYGAPGKRRRPVQLRFQKIKDLSPRGYKKLLAKYSITPGLATLQSQAQINKEDNNNNDNERDDDDDGQDDQDDDQDD